MERRAREWEMVRSLQKRRWGRSGNLGENREVRFLNGDGRWRRGEVEDGEMEREGETISEERRWGFQATISKTKTKSSPNSITATADDSRAPFLTSPETTENPPSLWSETLHAVSLRFPSNQTQPSLTSLTELSSYSAFLPAFAALLCTLSSPLPNLTH
ncbi:hypothetical protein Drorol1_Dr00025955 [Drosera rotundifolia]